jgi:N-acetylglucosaminyldiphosphoundecaprenol N-acetyl-beta-D-mannosaminyltransferase
MDMPVHAVTLNEAIQRIVDGLAHGKGGTVLTPNIDILRQYLSSPDLRPAFERTDLLVADGMPLVMASRLQRTPVPCQITGTDLLCALSAAAAAGGYSVFFVGGRPGDADRAVDRLRVGNPALRAQAYPCYVRPDTEEAELSKLSGILVSAAPDVVFVGLPFRTQVAVMSRMCAGLPTTWFVGVGSSFELVNGDRTRPPRWVQRLCLEWAWRLTSQPMLWRRYVVDGMPIAVRLALSALRLRWQGRARQAISRADSSKRPEPW